MGFLSEITAKPGIREGTMAGLNLKSRKDTNKAKPASVWQSPLMLSTIELINNSLRKKISHSTSLFIQAPGNIN